MTFTNHEQRPGIASSIAAYPGIAAHGFFERLCRPFHRVETVRPCRNGLNQGPRTVQARVIPFFHPQDPRTLGGGRSHRGEQGERDEQCGDSCGLHQHAPPRSVCLHHWLRPTHPSSATVCCLPPLLSRAESHAQAPRGKKTGDYAERGPQNLEESTVLRILMGK